MTHVICGDTKDSDNVFYNKVSLSLRFRLVRLHLYPQKLEQTTILLFFHTHISQIAKFFFKC